MMSRCIYALFLLLSSASFGVSARRQRALRSAVSEKDIVRQLAYTHLFPEEAFFSSDLTAVLNERGALKLAARISGEAAPDSDPLSAEQIAVIDKMTAHFPNKKLRGYGVENFQTLETLTSEEIDVSSAVAIAQGKGPDVSELASLDWMAWVIEQRLPKGASAAQCIEEINAFIFFDLGIRFPPKSQYADNIDRYTFLSAVLGKRQGVCLGVSVLYLCLAQRLGLDLEIVTPPGHIFVRAQLDGEVRNIETTARGIDVPTEHYLSVSAPTLKTCSLKDTIALVLINEASVYWHRKDYAYALDRYRLAQRLMPDDPLVYELMGICSFLNGDATAAHAHLRTALDHPVQQTICRDSLGADILQARCDIESVEAIFMSTDGRTASLLKKEEALKAAVKRNPYFRSGLFHLGCTYLQLGYHGKALETLEKAERLSEADPMCAFLLSQLYLEQMDLSRAWDHLIRSEKITGPRAVKEQREQRLELLRRSPLPQALSAHPDVEYIDAHEKDARRFWNWFFPSKKP